MIGLGLLTGLVGLAPAVSAASSFPTAGQILGQVRNNAGVTQMGATVLLYNRYDEMVRRTLTNDTGKFVFEGLAPDTYSIRVTLASFVPALRRNISVTPGSENLLKINLTGVLSTIELVPASESRGTLMSDDWKWVLRTSQATRPVLRLLPVSSSAQKHSNTSLFSQTTGVVRLSAGDSQTVSGSTAQDLGTAFALATLINGSARVRVSGNLGYIANTGLPAAGFRATYSHDKGGTMGPQVSLTGRQVYFPGLGGGSTSAADGESGPVLRTASLSMLDRLDLLDTLRIEYGAHLDSVSFIDRANYVSPFARATYDLGTHGSVRVAFSAGTQPAELIAANAQSQPGEMNQGTDLTQDLAALALLPQVSLRDGHMRLQRNETWEVGYTVVQGSRRYSATVYRESVADAAYAMSAPAGFLPQGDLLPSLDSQQYVFDVGNFRRVGYSVAAEQSLGDHAEITVAAGRAGALMAGSQQAPVDSAAGMRALIRPAQRSWVTARASATVPLSRTYVVTSYGWTDFRTLMPAHVSLTGTTDQSEGLTVYVRQPLPRLSGMHGRVEATAALQNILAQGYLPLSAGGHTAILTDSPRAVRGGLNFLF
jgi:Carboxypeptidase regulatory-like domain